MANIICKKNKLIKIVKKNIFGFILGLIVTSGIGICATTYMYNSNQVSYGDSDVKTAIDELYSLTNQEPAPKELTYIGSSDSLVARTINVAGKIANYKDLTVNDFYIVTGQIAQQVNTNIGSCENHVWTNITNGKTYNATNGILSIPRSSTVQSIGGRCDAFFITYTVYCNC